MMIHLLTLLVVGASANSIRSAHFNAELPRSSSAARLASSSVLRVSTCRTRSLWTYSPETIPRHIRASPHGIGSRSEAYSSTHAGGLAHEVFPDPSDAAPR